MNANPAYPPIVELELWLPPLSERAPLEGKEVATRCRQETGLPSDVVLGLNFVPNELDVEQLKHAVDMEEVRPDDFQNFCERRGLRSTPEDKRSAAEFLAFVHGQALAWLHLPAESSGLAMAKTLTRWALENDFAGARRREHIRFTVRRAGLCALAECDLTPHSIGAPAAGHQARSGGARYIFASLGLAVRR